MADTGVHLSVHIGTHLLFDQLHSYWHYALQEKIGKIRKNECYIKLRRLEEQEEERSAFEDT